MFSDRIIRRFIWIVAIAIIAITAFGLLQNRLKTDPGTFPVRQGNILLDSKKYEEALAAYDRALLERPDYTPALMGKVVGHLKLQQFPQAQEILLELIDKINRINSDPSLLDDQSRITLAAAYNNLAISYDLQQQYQEAIKNYVKAVQVDRKVVDGPGIIDRILHGGKPTTALERARYLYNQLKLPEEQRVMRIEEIDELQRSYKP